MSKAIITPFFIINEEWGLGQNIDISIEINGVSCQAKNKIGKIIIDFSELEEEIGEKVCFYVIKENNKNKEINKGHVKLHPGNSNFYIFLSNQGITCEFIFFKGFTDMPEFLNNKFEIEYAFGGINETIPVKLNTLNTPDRANLILINCPTNFNFKRNNITLFNSEILSKRIYNFSGANSFVICFHNNDYLNVEYQKIGLIEEINFKKIFSSNSKKVDEIYRLIKNILNSPYNNNLNLKIEELYDQNLKRIISKKIIGPKKILEKEFDKEEYLDFFYKLIFFFYLYKKRNSNNLEDFVRKLQQNYEVIKNDKDIKIYEKILLLKNIYMDDTLEKEDLIKYYKINKIDHNSPLYLAVDFLKSLINDLDYNTTFYYPLMCLDSGIFKILYKKDKKYELTSYGLNMFNIETIKNHLNNLIPNLVIISDSMTLDDYCHTYEGVGLVMLNNKIFGNDLDKKINDKNIREHSSFYLAINLFHEIFGHNKSSYGRGLNSFGSPVCFKDHIGLLRYLPYENDENIFLCLDDINNNIFNKLITKESSGDSGYFLEFFFGKIKNENVFDIIEEIKDKTNLGILLDVKLWNNNILLFRQYIELKSYFVKKSLDQNNINLNDDIIQQINKMENIIFHEQTNNEIIIVENKNPHACHLSRKKKFLIKKFNFFKEQDE